MSLPMVSFTCDFVYVNTKNDSRRLNVEETSDKAVQPTKATTNYTTDGTRNRNNNNVTVDPLKTFIDVYFKIMETDSWIDELT